MIVKVTGYSERGVLNSLLYQIAYSEQANDLLAGLLATAHFPRQGRLELAIREAEVLVEQSLSDFGDADAVLLLRTLDGPVCVFVEAKVKPCQAPPWRIEQEFDRFWAGTQGTVDSSNLFTQMYHKVRFSQALRVGWTQLEQGVRFPPSSSKATRKIGNNAVVRRAVEKMRPYIGCTYFLALVPDETRRVVAFFERLLAHVLPEGYEGWDTAWYGHLSWHEVEVFCQERKLSHTLDVLEFNRGQID